MKAYIYIFIYLIGLLGRTREYFTSVTAHVANITVWWEKTGQCPLETHDQTEVVTGEEANISWT